MFSLDYILVKNVKSTLGKQDFTFNFFQERLSCYGFAKLRVNHIMYDQIIVWI